MRDAGPGDAAAVAEIHVVSWKATYRGLLPDEPLDRLAVGDRLPMWQRYFDRPRGERGDVLVVLDDGGTVCGFANAAPAAGHGEAVAELFTIYLHPDAWGTGLGHLLHEALVERLRERGYREAVLHVHPGNGRARRFYEAHGWRDDGVDRHETIWDVDVAERRYRLTGLQG